MSTVAVLHASELVTLAGPARPRIGAEMREPGIIRDGAMLVRDGMVERVGTTDELAALITANTRVIDAEGRVVLPGFVDAHTHPIFAGDRLDEFEQRSSGATYEQIAANGGGIRSTVAKTRAASEEQLLAQARKHAQWFLEGGTTTVEAKSGYGLTLADEIKMLRVTRHLNAESPIDFVPTFLGAHAVPDEFRDAPADYLDLVVRTMLPEVASERLAEFCDVFCEAGYFAVEAAREVLTAARERGLRLRIHADQLTNSGAATLASEVGAITADHLEQTDERGIAAMKAGGVQPVLLPASVYSLGKTRYPHARAMIDAGLAVVLATDFNPGSSPTTSLQMVMSLATTQMRMTPAEALSACTINAAYSLCRGESVGSLEVGKFANFCVCECSDVRELAYYFGRNPSLNYVYGAITLGVVWLIYTRPELGVVGLLIAALVIPFDP